MGAAVLKGWELPDSSVCTEESDSMVLVGLFQLRLFCDSMNCKVQMFPRMLCSGASSDCVYLGGAVGDFPALSPCSEAVNPTHTR